MSSTVLCAISTARLGTMSSSSKYSAIKCKSCSWAATVLKACDTTTNLSPSSPPAKEALYQQSCFPFCCHLEGILRVAGTVIHTSLLIDSAKVRSRFQGLPPHRLSLQSAQAQCTIARYLLASGWVASVHKRGLALWMLLSCGYQGSALASTIWNLLLAPSFEVFLCCEKLQKSGAKSSRTVATFGL